MAVVLTKMIIRGILVNMIASVRKHIKLTNTTETSLDDIKVTCEKNNCLIHMILVVVKCLLFLAVFPIGCYYYYTKEMTKKENVVSY